MSDDSNKFIRPNIMTDKWLPNTWRAKKAKHIPNYENKKELEEVLSSITYLSNDNRTFELNSIGSVY